MLIKEISILEQQFYDDKYFVIASCAKREKNYNYYITITYRKLLSNHGLGGLNRVRRAEGIFSGLRSGIKVVM